MAFSAQPAQACSDAFVTHELDHRTTTRTRIPELYESNGAGVAINDLDNDGDPDIVLANLHDLNTILWNEGELAFRTERLSHGGSRAVNIVDVDGDGWQDIVFTRRFEKPTYWRNLGAEDPGSFTESVLAGVNNPFYTMDWGDIDGDGDLDLAAASYDTELRKEEGAVFVTRGNGVGVFIYLQDTGVFESHRLATQADALAMALADLNEDGRLDLIVGNDFARPDYLWLQTDDGWAEASFFAATAENTMSIDLGDVDNNGAFDLLATDMKPYATDPATQAAWEPLMEMMTHPETAGDRQVVENVLLMADANGEFVNVAADRALNASGWAWSSKFGDLDNDGALDVYVVNGMIAAGLFDHLENSELIEENQAYRNNGGGFFSPAPQWALNSTASGRGMSMADLDGDGDLDIVVNNLLAPAQLFENQLCAGEAIEVELQWRSSLNPAAIGATAILQTSAGAQRRTVRAASGYLSGDPARLHFGVAAEAEVQSLHVQWPDGMLSEIDGPTPGALLRVTRP